MPGHFGRSHSHGDKKSNNKTSSNNNVGSSLHGGPKYKAPPSQKFTSYTKQNLNPNNDTAAKTSLFKQRGATKIQNMYMGAASVTKPFFKAGSVKTRTYFVDDVLTSKRAKKNIGYTQKEFENLATAKQEEVYKDYLANRSSGKTDAFGNVSAGYSREKIVHTNKDGTKEFRESIVRTDGGGGNNQARANVVTTKNVGGTTILTTEGKVAEDKMKSEEYDSRKTKRKGRRNTILTSQRGASGNFILGKPTLLGA